MRARDLVYLSLLLSRRKVPWSSDRCWYQGGSRQSAQYLGYPRTHKSLLSLFVALFVSIFSRT